MRILIVSATPGEVSFITKDILSAKAGTYFSIVIDKHAIDILITGVGMMLTAFHLGMCLKQNKYDLILNIGLAGALNKQLQPGEVVVVNSDAIGDLGAEDDQSFLDIYELGLSDKNEFPFNNGKLVAIHPYQHQLGKLKNVVGITVNKVHGNDESIAKLLTRTEADVETMEGAAFFYACLYHKMNCIQLRSISNYVEKRDKSKWNIQLALDNLQVTINNFFKNIS